MQSGGADGEGDGAISQLIGSEISKAKSFAEITCKWLPSRFTTNEII